MFYNSSYDEANYYQGNKFQIGGNDRQGQNLDLVLGKTPGARGGRSDEKIVEDAWHALIRNHKIDLRDLEVNVRHGILRLSGHVRGLPAKQEAERTLAKVPGIIDIINDLRP